MGSVAKIYTDEIFEKFKYLGTWLPGTAMHLGEVGKMEKTLLGEIRVFTKVTSLKNKGVKFKTTRVQKRNDILRHDSRGGVTFDFTEGGTASPAQLNIRFSRQNAIVFMASGVTENSIDDKESVEEQILRLYEDGDWDKDYVVVTDVVSAEKTSVFISSKSGDGLTIRGKIPVQGIDALLLNPKASYTQTGTIGTSYQAKSSLTPLFKAMRVKKPLFGKAKADYSMQIMTRLNYTRIDDDREMEYLTPADLQ